MFKFRLGTGAAAMIMTGLWLFGCGGANKAEKKPESAATIDPFGVGSADLRAGSPASSEEDDDDVDTADLQVPGSEYGKKKGGGGATAKANCPKGKAGKKCRDAAKAAGGPIPESKEITGQMEGIPWGLNYRAVMKNFEKRIDREYEAELKNTRDAVEEYNIRTRLNKEKSKLDKSYVEFSGKTTGYEGAVLEGEFTHNNGESMLEWDAGKFVEYLFFFNGRFWKRLRTFRKEALNIPDFETYICTLEAKFGPGKRINDEKGALSEVRWQNDDTYMTAKDKSGFYGVFCLYFTARVTEDNLAKLRPNADKPDGSVGNQVSDMVQSVTSGDIADHDAAVLDGYTGVNTGGKTVTVDAGHSVMSGEKSDSGAKGGKKGKNAKGQEAPPAETGGGGGSSDGDIF